MKKKLFDLLKEDYPELISDNKVDIVKFKEMIEGNYISNNLFTFTWPSKELWHDKIENIEYILKDNVEIKEDNVLIEADNLLGLSYLKDKMKENIDLIYIDLPYNTGNSFIYKDNFKNRKIKQKNNDNIKSNIENQTYKHVEWLDFIYPRLLVAKKLLSEKGLIFISIDENEHSYLKIMCDEIFGEDNFVSDIVWQDKYTILNDKKGVCSQTEYILVYSKDISHLRLHNEPLREEYIKKAYRNPDNDSRGLWRSTQLYKTKNQYSYTVVSPTGKEWTKPWNFNQEGWKKLEKDNRIYWGKDGNRCPTKKIFLSESRGRGHRNLWLGEEVGYTQDGGKDLEELFGDRNLFPYPKPVSLIQKIIRMATDEDSIVLDFFAGSGTTAQAVIEQNIEDKGNRKFILIQTPEPLRKKKTLDSKEIENIFQITEDRVKRVIQKHNISIDYKKIEINNK